jgi:hypothetical protein
LVTAGKHANNIRAIGRQLLGKRVSAAKDIHATVEVLLDYNNGNGVFYVVHAECYKQGQLSSRAEVVSCQLSVESQPVKRRLECWCEMATSLGPSQMSRALQGRLRRDGTIVELTVDKSSVVGYLLDTNDVSVGS